MKEETINPKRQKIWDTQLKPSKLLLSTNLSCLQGYMLVQYRGWFM